MKKHCVKQRRARPLLGTFVDIEAQAPGEPTARRAVERAFDAIVRVQRLMSFHELTSDVSRINRDAGRHPVRIQPWTARVLRAAQTLAQESGGVFDVTVAASLRRGGFLPQSGPRRCRGTWRDIEITRDNRVRFVKPLLIDLGGIAKGFAVDRAIEAMQRSGAFSGFVNAGGDLRVFGDREELVAVRSAADPKQLGAVVRLQNRALATSAVYFSRNVERKVSALLDGRNRRALLQDVSVTVSAPECMIADGLTKIALVLRERSLPILRRHSAEAFLLEDGGRVFCLSENDAPKRHQA